MARKDAGSRSPPSIIIVTLDLEVVYPSCLGLKKAGRLSDPFIEFLPF